MKSYDVTLSGPARGVAGASEYSAGWNVYLDCTAGMGGHTKAIAARLSEAGTVIANDRDPQSLEMARANTAEYWDRIEFQHAAFSELNHKGLDGMLADLGVSRFHLTDPERGFSFMSDGPLDMRLDQTRGVTAADLVNHSAEKQIADWLYQLGEERRARKITGALIRGRPVRSTRHLADIVERAVPRSGPIHPATRTFMALRMVVNQEMEELDALLHTRAADGSRRRTHRHHFISLSGRPQSKEQFSRTDSNGQGGFTHKKACCSR